MGASAMIDTRTIVLCGEPNSTKRANSWAWAGVEHRFPIFPTEPLEYGIDKWFQVGYVRQRIEGGDTNLVGALY